jgi:hypothetical protein
VKHTPDLPVRCASGETVLQVEIAEEILTPYEWVEEGKSYREWLVPADILNKAGHIYSILSGHFL